MKVPPNQRVDGRAGGYRPDIDGIRAIAVLAVVMFHAFPTLLTGGFIGVDVFFVMSGFLITRILRDGVTVRTFSFSEFYERRIRRLVPALVVVVAATALVGLIILPPGDLKDLGRSIAPSMLFTANYHFAHKTGYFAPADDVRPLLHLWSLAVEEQFYIVWPLVIWLGARAPQTLFPKLAFSVALAVAIALSLGADEIAARHDPLAAFFHTPLRAWEPLTGAAIAVWWTRPIRAAWMAELLAAAGLAAILVSLFVLNAATPVPGLAALPACLGAGLLLQAGRFGGRTWVARGLSWPPVVYVGALSYSFYLWHWPVLTFLRLGSPAEPPATVMAAGVVLSLALAALSFRFIERPYRRRPQNGLSRRALFAVAIAAVALLAGLGEILSADGGLRHRVHGVALAADTAERDFPTTGACSAPTLGVAGLAAPTHCAFGAARPGPPDLVLLGDSEAEAWEAGVADFALARGLKGQLVNVPACPPVIGVDERDPFGQPAPCPLRPPQRPGPGPDRRRPPHSRPGARRPLGSLRSGPRRRPPQRLSGRP